VAVAPDNQSAVATLTGKGRVAGESDFFVQELKFTLKRVEGEWLIYRVETVKTFRNRELEIHLAFESVHLGDAHLDFVAELKKCGGCGGQ